MPELSAEDAVQALAQAWEADEAPSTGQTSVTPEAPSEVESTESNQEAEKPSGLFYDIDPNSLPEELKPMFDGMNKAFTQKTQELAEQRKQYESFGTPEQVQQAVEFVSSLQDPQNLVQLHSDLSEYLQENGFTKAQADEAATSAIQEQSQEEDFGFEDPTVKQLQSELESLKSWRENFEAQQEQAAVEAQIERTEIQLRQDRNYSDEDVSRIYSLAWSTGGDLVKAADAYDSWRNDIVAGYVNKKAEAPSAVPPIATGHGQKIESFGNDFEAAHKYAKQYAITLQQAGELDN